MRRQHITIAFALVLPLILACNLLKNPAGQPVAGAPPTRTPRPTFTATLPPRPNAPVPSQPQQADATVQPTPTQTPANTPPPEPSPTNTPVPEPTNTPEPPPTNTPVPLPTNTPAPPPPPTNTPVPQPAGPVVGRYGISGKVTARDKTTFAVGEKAFFVYEATNHTDAPVSFGKLGIKASNGQFNTSWINPDTIYPGVPFKHDDGLTFDVPGTYQVFLAICYFGCDGGDAVWEEYPDGAATITVQ